MEQAEIFSRRIRRLTIATGVASALALFPILFLLSPALLVVGGIIQPRFPATGRWFVWAGASLLIPVLIVYDVMMLRDAFSSGPYTSTPLLMTLTFPPATILLIWCYAELVVHSLQKMRAWRLLPAPEPRPVPWGAWTIAAVLNFLAAWELGSFLSWHRDPGYARLDASARVALAMQLVMILIVVAFDISLVNRVVRLRRARIAEK
jgi:hypothetical protein